MNFWSITKVMKAILPLFIVLATASVTLADSVACQPGTVATLANTSCSIGDKEFIFGTASIRDDSGSGLTTADITFTPDASNPNGPGFILSGFITATSSTTVEDELDWLNIQILTLSGQPLIRDLSATVDGNAQPGGSTVFAEFNACETGSSTNCVFAEPGIKGGVCTTGPCTDHGDFSPSLAMTDTNSFVAYGIAVGNGNPTATATARGASFFVSEAPSAVPEPSSIILLATGLLGTMRARRKVRP